MSSADVYMCRAAVMMHEASIEDLSNDDNVVDHDDKDDNDDDDDDDVFDNYLRNALVVARSPWAARSRPHS